ncbi:hypothetical protein C4544_02915 [candidate division WS5 bacterium]|uniref:Uncharacterized protein n=1 Tax=candidate division WS5 bacterium TaxID=2093353 RepID=A0A419DED6_9BACT|nr:MAG: hypothetical protein C4544_02915 [candidate division WS5 bacterium]
MVVANWNRAIRKRLGEGYELVFVDLDKDPSRKDPDSRYSPAIIKIAGTEHCFPGDSVDMGGLTAICEEFKRLKNGQ